MRLDDKRGMALGDIYPAVLTIIMIGLILGIGIYILAEVGDELATTAGTVTNETGLQINVSATVAQATAPGFNTFVLGICYGNYTGTGTNTPANLTIVAANYTSNAQTGVITNATANTYDDVACSYTYLYGTDASEAVDTTVDGVGDFAGWLAIIVVVIAAAVVLGIVLSSFGRKTPGI